MVDNAFLEDFERLRKVIRDAGMVDTLLDSLVANGRDWRFVTSVFSEEYDNHIEDEWERVNWGDDGHDEVSG